MTNIVSGFLLTDRMLKMFKQTAGGPLLMSNAFVQLSYLAATIAVHLFAALDERSEDRAPRRVRRRRRR